MREILRTGVESHECTPALGDVVAQRAAQHREAGLDGIEDGTLRHGGREVEGKLSFNARNGPQRGRQHHPDHDSVCTSTDSTAGRSRTIACQWSPASGEQYTCPPVVPK